MSIKKQYLKSRPVCKVTFSPPSSITDSAGVVQLVGEFNKWDTRCTPMKKNKNGLFSEIIELEPGKQYQFKYLIDGASWNNDPEADGFEKNEFAGENSVLIL